MPRAQRRQLRRHLVHRIDSAVKRLEIAAP
jgi:hypothetical protein